MPTGLLKPSSTPGLMSSLAPGPQREAALAKEMAALELRASGLRALSGELYDLVARYDPGQLIPSIAGGASMVVGDSESVDDAPRVFSMYAKIEYLAGLALAGPPGTGDVDKVVTLNAARLVSSVFDAADALLHVQAMVGHGTGHEAIDETSNLLRMERLYDRMAGYEVHLQEIGDAVFEPHRSLYCEEFGFCPSDAIRLVRRHDAWINAGLAAFQDAVLGGQDDSSILWSISRMDSICKWTPSLISHSTQLPVDEVAAILDGMSVDFGCQPEFRTPFDDNHARRYPLIRLRHGEYLVPVPRQVAHGVHGWVQGYIRDNPTSRLAEKYPKHRSDAAELLVRGSLETIFGEDTVFGNQHYDSSDGHGEIDCLVAGSTPIIAEVKSRGLTEQGRQGYPQRIRSVADDVVAKSFKQTVQARNYIMQEGGRCFAGDQRGEAKQLLNHDVTGSVEIVVTLERMDPLVTTAGKLAGTGRTRDIWVTNLTDFLMVRDILDDPASFLHYARTRCAVSKLGIQVFMESDALGAYLDDRLTFLIDCATESQDEHTEIQLDYWSTEINQFFTMLEIATGPEKPGTGVPPALSEALRACSSGYPRAWVTAATAVMDAHPSVWRAWRNFIRRHKKGEHPFNLPCGTASVILSEHLAHVELRDEPTPTLAIPRRMM